MSEVKLKTNPKDSMQINGQLKALKRRGWLQRNCLQTESDAEHSWGVAFLAMIYTPKELDKLKCIQLALVHDVVEIKTGDITPQDNVLAEVKQERELFAMSELSESLKQPELKELFEEYEDNLTPEAQFIHDLDKKDMIMQCRYFIEQAQLSDDAWNEFTSYSSQKIQTKLGKCLFKDVFDGFLKKQP